MKTLVLVEHDGSSIKDATLAAVTAASQLGEVHLLVAGKGVGAIADAAAKIAGVGNRTDARSGDQQMDLAQLRPGGHRGEGRVLDLLAVMLDQYKSLHLATPSAFSLPTSSSTEPTLIPALRLAGSTTLITSSRGATSTP